MMHLKNQSLLFYFCIVLVATSCSTVKRLKFEVPVDTRSKRIHIQKKKVFRLDAMGLYATNDFLASRLNGFEMVNDSTAKVIITPENAPINNSAYYSFKLWSTTAKTYYLLFDYPEEYGHRYIPKLKRGAAAWKSADSLNFIHSYTDALLKIEVSKDTVWVSAQESVSSVDTKNWYTKLTKGKAYVHVNSAGESVLKRNLPVLDIYKNSTKNKPIVVLLTRQHPPELTGYFAFQSFLTTILNESKLSHSFLEKYRLLVFPIVNPDGVDLGHWRHNAGGIDTNRDWGKYRQPEIKNITRYIVKAAKESNSTVLVGIDFHSTQKDMYYTNETRNVTAHPDFIENWFTGIENSLKSHAYIPEQERGNSTKPVSKGWLLKYFKANTITYEIGDETPRDFVRLKASVAANEMMKLLVTW